MAGYQQDFSRSNNAQNAIDCGRLPISHFKATDLKRAGVPLTLAELKFAVGMVYTIGGRAVSIRPSEWHHAGCRYRKVDHYDLGQISRMLAELPELTAQIKSDFAASKIRAKQERAAKAASQPVFGTLVYKVFSKRGRRWDVSEHTARVQKDSTWFRFDSGKKMRHDGNCIVSFTPETA